MHKYLAVTISEHLVGIAKSSCSLSLCFFRKGDSDEKVSPSPDIKNEEATSKSQKPIETSDPEEGEIRPRNGAKGPTSKTRR